MKRHAVLTISSLAVLSLLAACSDDTKGSTPVLPGATEAVADGASLPASGDTGAVVDAAAGSCNVTVAGALTSDWTVPGVSGSVGYGPWIGNPGITTAMGAIDETFFILNCADDTGNYVGFMTQNEAKIPMEPATYTISMDSSVLSNTGEGTMVSVVTLAGSETNWTLSADGQLVITEFDEQHIAGTFTLPMTDALATLTGTSAGDVVVSGEFNYANLN